MFESMLRAFRHKNYKLYFFGQGISLIGNWLTNVAMSWMVYRLTKEGAGNAALLLGIVGFSEQIPMLILAPIGGVFADRWNRRTILIVTNVLSMLQTASIALLLFLNLISIPLIIGLSIFQGVVNSLDMPARQAFLVEIVEHRDDLPNAIALNSSMFNGARLVGPAMAGLLIASVGETLCFVFDAISYLAVILSLFAMVILPRAAGPERQSPAHEFKEGIKYSLGSPPILTILIFVGLISFLCMPTMVLMPIFADQMSATGHGASTLGFLMASSGIGALVGAAYLATRKSVVGISRVMVMASVALGASLVCFTLMPDFWARMASLSVGGFGMILVMASGNTFLQSVVPDDMRGRVMSLFGTAVMGISPFGSLLAGGLATHIGEPATLNVSGIGCIVAGLIFAATLPSLRKHVHPMYLAKGIIVPPLNK